MSHRILIIEDDAAILRGLELNLQVEGYEVLTATDGIKGLTTAEQETVDLIILDIMLPGLNGFQILQRLRAGGLDIPILLLSAKNAEVDKIMGLDLGADDYLTKPFGIGEFMARVKAHLRRVYPSTLYRWDDIEVDLKRDLIRKSGQVLSLNTKELDLLKLLLSKEGRAVTRESILNAVWGRGYLGTDRTVDNFITRLRQKLDDVPPKHILTVRGVGYRFVLEPET